MTLSNALHRPDRLRWIISTLLLAPSLSALAGGTTPVNGVGGLPVIHDGHGVPVIDIVPPNAQGLSHNQFLEYNVASPGVVLNNALHDGTSALAGALSANPQFQGQAASTILNEVLGNTPSSIFGAQEVFGQAADYVLANPNGITVNGASLINIKQATFLVGSPEVQDGQIKAFNALHSAGMLNIGERGLDHDGALNLLTPFIEQQGDVTGDGDTTIVIGHNRIAYANNEVLDTAAPSPTNPAIDAKLLGALQGGRIRIVSTTQGAGVRLPTNVLGRNGVSVHSAGAIHSTGEADTPARINGGQGDVTLQAEGDLTLVAVELEGGDVRGTAGGHLRLDAASRQRIEKTNEQWSRKAWFIPTEAFSRERTDTRTEHIGSRAVARGEALFSAGKDLAINGSEVQAGGALKVGSGGELRIDGVVNQARIDEQVRHRKHLWRGDSDQHSVSQTVRGSTLQGASVALEGAGDVNISGSNVRSEGALVVKAGEHIRIDSVALNNTREHREFRGDLVGGSFFGKRNNGTGSATQHQGSTLIANGDQHLSSEQSLTFVGSSASAGQRLHVQAKGELQVLAAAGQGQSDATTRSQGFTASAAQTKTAQDDKPDSMQYTAEVGYRVSSTRQQDHTVKQQPSALQGGQVQVDSDRLINLQGSHLTSIAGDTALKAPAVHLLAAREQHNTHTDTRSGGGSLQVSGGIDRLGSAFKGDAERQQLGREADTAAVSQLQSAGAITVVTQNYQTEGASITSAGTTQVLADTTDHRAALDHVTHTQVHTGGKGTLGASLEYRDLTRPIEKLVTGVEQTRFQQPNVEDALAPPSLGADLDAGYLNRNEHTVSQIPRATRYQGAEIDVQVAGALRDEATHYDSQQQVLNIQAGSHEVLAVEQYRDTTVRRTELDVGVRVDTNTGSDLNVRVSGVGSSIDRHTRDSQAVVGSLSGKQGIAVQLGTDGLYEGAVFNGGGGDVAVTAAGQLALEQADHRQVSDETLIDGSAWAKGGSSPVAGKSFGGSALGKYVTGQRNDSQALPAQIDAQGRVRLESSGELRLVGTRIGSAEQPVAALDTRSEGRQQWLASTDTHQATGKTLGGGLQPNLSHSSTGKGGGLGGHFEWANVAESARSRKGGGVHSDGQIVLASNSRDASALHMQGLNAQTGDLQLQTPRGGQLIEAATSTEYRNNKSTAAGVALNGSAHQDTSQNTSAISGRARLGIDQHDSTTHTNSQLRADRRITLNSRLDVNLAGAQLDAEQVNGRIDGDLIVQSVQDKVNSVSVEVDARLSGEKNPQGLVNGVSAFAGPAAGKVKEQAGQQIKLFDTGLTPSLKVDVVKQDRTQVAKASSINGRTGVDLTVDGSTRLTGATLNASQGQVQLGAGSLELTDLNGRDYRAEALLDLSNEPVDLVQGIIDATQRKASGETSIDLGLIRAGGHDRLQVQESGVRQKQG